MKIAGLRNVSLIWPSTGIQACRDVSLDLHTGTIHALAGENGAGKTTLGHILAGVQKADSGTLELGEKVIRLNSHSGRRLTGLVRQRSIWPAGLTAAEAAALGSGRVRMSQINKQFRVAARQWSIRPVDPKTPVSRLNAAELQRAQLIASLMTKPEILVLDEAAAEDKDDFFRLLKDLKDSGMSVLWITHRLNDIFDHADQITVMRHGELRGSWPVSEVSQTEITQHMFGAVPRSTERRKSTAAESDRPVLQAADLVLTERGRRVLDRVSFGVFPGEILGITGLKEEGLSSLEDILCGTKKISSGQLTLEGRPFRFGKERRSGLRLIPPDGRGVSLQSTVTENMMILKSRRLSRAGWLSARRMRHRTEVMLEKTAIKGSADHRVNELSGGNLQKLILARESEGLSRILIAADPARNLDEAGRGHLYRMLYWMKEHGTAILVLSPDPEETVEISDRIAVLSAGQLTSLGSDDGRQTILSIIAGTVRGRADEIF